MENLVVLYTKEISFEDLNVAFPKLKGADSCNINYPTEIDISIPSIEVQPGCIKLSPCGNVVAAINRRTNELLVYSHEIATGVVTPPFFTHTLELAVNEQDNRKIMGWDKAALGQYRGQESKENAVFMQKANTPFPDLETSTLSWSRFETSEQAYICVNAYTSDLKRYLALFSITNQRLDSSWHEISMDHKLGHVVAWRPRCNQVAVPFQSGDGNYVGIWERGALVRGLPLGIDNLPVRGLEFSDDGTALVAWQQLQGVGGGYISVYMYSNGDWMRKQQLCIVEALREVEWTCAIEECQLVTYTVKLVKESRDESWIQWGLKPDVTKDGEIVLIDGHFVNITCMKKEVLPPGACSLQLELASPSTSANQVFLHNTKPLIAVLCERMSLHFYDRQTGVTLFDRSVNIRFACNDYRLFGEWLQGAELDQSDVSIDCEHFRLRNEKFEQIVVCNQIGCKNQHCAQKREEGIIIAVARRLKQTDGVVEDVNERIRQEGTIDVNGTIFTFKLDFNGHFYIDTDLVSKEINSLCLNTDYLFLTTYKTLYYMLVSIDNVTAIIKKCRVEFGTKGPPSTEAFTRYNLPFIHQRPIEVQAKLLTGSIGGLVLVMTRGNFETLQIPQIGARTVANLMAHSKFKEAVSTVHLLNLDPNVVIDSNIEGFIDNAAQFVSEVSDQSLSHLLISLKGSETHLDKRTRVCLALRDALLPCEGSFLPTLLPMIALTNLQATVPSNPIAAMMDIDAFLKLALKCGMDEAAIRSVVDDTLRSLQAACGKEMKWFEYALRVTDEQELARIVADVSRMDPRVYEPLLNELNKYKDDKCLYHHHVYKFLGEDDRALLMLLEWHKKTLPNDTEMVLEFIQEKHLSRRTMGLLVDGVATGEQETGNINALILALHSDVTCELLASHDRVYIKYAAALFERVNQHDNAIAANSICHNMTIAIDAVTSAAAMNPEEVISALVKDGQYTAAVSMARNIKRKDLIDTVVSQGITERSDILSGQIKQLDERFTKMCNRLKKVRREYAERLPQQRLHVDDDDNNDVFDDTASMATTAISTSVSISTNASSNKRRQRRAARKADKLREGHARENINLVKVLYDDIQWIFGLTQVATEFYEINIAHPRIIGQDARFLIRTTLMLQKDMIAKAREIWPEEINIHLDPINPGMSEVQIRNITALQHNWNYLDMMYRAPPVNMKNILKTINSEKQ